MTRVRASSFYEWEFTHDTAECEECDTEMDVDEGRDVMEEPHWRRDSGRFQHVEDVFEALCDACYAQEVSDFLDQDSSSTLILDEAQGEPSDRAWSRDWNHPPASGGQK